MEQNFNLKRAILLFKATIIIYRKSFFLYLPLVVIGLISALTIWDIFTSENGVMEFETIRRYGLYMMIGAISAPLGQMQYAGYKSKLSLNITHMVPASKSEKFFVPVVVGVISLIAIIASYVATVLIYSYIIKEIGGNADDYLNVTLYLNSSSNRLVALVVVLCSSYNGIFAFYPNRVAWGVLSILVSTLLIPIAILLISGGVGSPTITYYLENVLPYLIVTQVVILWVIMYFRFGKIELKK